MRRASPVPDDLATWIADLRGRVRRGDLDGQGTFTIGIGTVPVGVAARILLADVDRDRDLTPAERHAPFGVERRRRLLSDLRRLREQVG